MQEIAIDFDALDASYIPGTEFCFWGSLQTMDPFQPQLTSEERDKLLDSPMGSCGGLWPLDKTGKNIADYWIADDD